MPELVLSVDAGTTGITVLCVDPSTNVVGRAYSEFTQYYPKPGWVEHDAEEIWNTTRSVMGRALVDAGAQAADIAGIGITNQRETTVVWERTTGRPIAPAIVWQCRRSAAICERLRTEGLEPELRKRTGLVCDPYFSATKIMWYLENIDGVRAHSGGGRARLRDDRYVADLEPMRRRGPRDRAFERVPHDALLARRGGLGPVDPLGARHPRIAAAGGQPSSGGSARLPSSVAGRSPSRVSPEINKPRSSDRRASRSGWRRTLTGPGPSC